MASISNQIGPYVLIQKLGKGAFGEVWLAEHRTAIASTQVALKLPLSEQIELEEIKQEAQVWTKASGHPNILPIIEANIYNGQIVIVSEYVAGGSLESFLEKHRGKAPSIEFAVEITLGILAGLEHLHRQQIIHRDLKPANILLQGETPRLADFGLSRTLKLTAQSTTIAGTPTYMAPETFNGKRSEQTDIWAVGVMFYQMMTGQYPFVGNDMMELVGSILTREIIPLPSSVPTSLQRIVKKSLTKVPEEKYRSANEMREALKQAISLTQKKTQKNLVSHPAQFIKMPKGSATPIAKNWVDLNLVGKVFAGILGGFMLIVIIASRINPSKQTKRDLNTPVKKNPKINSEKGVEEEKQEVWKEYWNGSYFDFTQAKWKALNSADQIECASAYQDWYAKTYNNGIQEKTFSSGEVSMEFVLIPPGKFEGGVNGTISEAFWCGKYEVTQGQWKEVMGSNPSNFKGSNLLPVEKVSWDESKIFCSKTSWKLPSETQWEYMCRAGTTRKYSVGDEASDLGTYAWYYENSPNGTKNVGQKQPNAWGVYDMQGNVWEWCEDRYKSSMSRVMRGGGWNGFADYCSSGYRYGDLPSLRGDNLGFRVVRSLP